MKRILHLKCLLMYIIFAFLSVFVTALLTSQLVLKYFTEEEAKSLYRNAASVTTEYLPEYFEGSISHSELKLQLEGMRSSLNADIWFVKDDGIIISSAPLSRTHVPGKIENFDPAETGGKPYIVGNYHKYFKEDVITTVSPVSSNFTTKGYLLIHKPLSHLEYFVRQMMKPVFMTVGIILVLAGLLYGVLVFFIFKPLQTITNAAQQYASGNLDYEIPIHTHDEFGYLSASLNYMSTQLKNMEEYEKKIVANVSHDFRSPLTSIKGYVEAMADGTIPPELHNKYLNIISFETDRLTDLTQDLLTLNQYDMHALILNKTAFDIQEMIKKTAASFEGKCLEKHISINLVLLPTPAYVYADKRKIQQVVYNLMDNAIKFSQPELSVTVEVSEKGDDKYSISVTDSGEGIPKKDLGKIWERFYKSDASRGKDKKGTGLGLAIVKEAITAHDEYINVISTEGVGTEFTFHLTKASDANM